MALQTVTNPPPPSAQEVGNKFVEEYYDILHHSPELVSRFYHESSVLSRSDSSGVVTSVTTVNGILDKILSLNFKEYKSEIKTADSQKSFMEGVTVLVTGCLTRKDNWRRNFSQSFFLAPQDNGYFVLNDIFRYVEDQGPLELCPVIGDAVAAVARTPKPEPGRAADPSAPDLANSHVKESEAVVENVEEVEGHSIYIRNLPLNVTVAQLETVFKKFGTIKPGGIQVRSNKQHGYCFGFVEFLSLDSMNSAIQIWSSSVSGYFRFL